MSTPERSPIEPLLLPRHMAALNAIAAKQSLSVVVTVESYEGETARNILARWSGTREQLFAVGLFTPTQQRLPLSRGTIIVPSSVNWHRYPLLRGYVSVDGPNVVYEVNFGPVPRQIEARGDIEVCLYDDGASYHGSADALIHLGVCNASQLPLGRVRWNRDHPKGPFYEGQKWFSRRQPDGTFLHWLESEAARQKRVYESQERRKTSRAETAASLSWLANSYGKHAEPPAEKARPTHLRLVASDGQRREPQS